MLKVRTLFSGIGSPESALKNLGIEFELVDFCEIDKYAVKSYCAIHGVDESKNLGDISKVWGRNLPYADMLVWGFPCTDISIAGKQKGIVEGETRSGLYYEGLRILKETKPKYSIIENVKNLTGKQFKEQFKQMLEDIDEIGYNNYWQILNAKNYGIPQNRERVFIVSIRKDIDSGFEFPKGFDNGLRLKDMLEDEVNEKFYISNEKVEKLMAQPDYQDQPKFKDFASGIGVCEPIRLGGIFDGEVKHQAGAVWGKEGICPTIDTMQGGYRQPLVIVKETTKLGYAITDMSATGYRIRKLTPKECFRLMGFNDEEFQRCVDVGVSNSQLYKQAGNSIVTNVLYHIFNNLLPKEVLGGGKPIQLNRGKYAHT